MPYVFEIGGRTAVVEDSAIRRITDQLVRKTRILIWARAGGPDSMFEHYYRIWEDHNNCHSINLFVLAMEALGGAELPPAGMVNKLRREQTKLAGLLRPNSIHQFYQRFAAFNRKQLVFVRLMKTYLANMIDGGGSAVRILELTRNGSFMTLSVCAAILTGGSSAAAAGGARALLQDAAAQFVVGQIQSSATGVGRIMAGENVTMVDAADSVIDNALNSALGGVIGRLMGPMTGPLAASAQRAIARGALGSAVGAGFSQKVIEDAVGRAVDRMMSRRPSDIRGYLNASRGERNDRGNATAVANGLSRNRNYLRFLEIELNNAA